uniref:Prospero homeobox 2 n=1 Tax=Jaculus jaculus TaxID=51337 RepID=A0A8C5L085_JACJA
MDPASVLLSPQSQACSHLAEPCKEDERSPPSCELGRDSPFPWSQLPVSSLPDPGWFVDEHIRAKRARVETIVQGMGLSPSPLVPGSARARDNPCCPEKARERKRKQRLPMQQGLLKPDTAPDQSPRKGGPGVREQLQLLQQRLTQLQEHILQASEPRAPAQGLGGSQHRRGPRGAGQRAGCRTSPCTADSDPHQAANHDLPAAPDPRVAEVDRQREESTFCQALLAVLRTELSKAVAQAVETVLQKVLLDPAGHPTQGRSFQGLVTEGRSQPPSPGESAYKDPLALGALPRSVYLQAGVPLGSLSLTEPLDSPVCHISPRGVPKPRQGPPANCPLTTVPLHTQENQLFSQLLGHGRSGRCCGAPPQGPSPRSHPCPESALPPWVLSQQQLPLPFPTALPASGPLLSSAKREQGDLQAVAEALPFSSIHIQEGLNAGHLKKAKLMFFFTRYPSANLLKVHFPDVQFNRCITSQMIKWFSNFREFYYIQMEKYARQAIADGVTNPKMLVVLRDAELFRVLNTHYNKGNDFEVPDCFLETASVTLQEFFCAVATGKDSAPSWKKPIYKIISKLDSDIPERFRSSSYPQDLCRS